MRWPTFDFWSDWVNPFAGYNWIDFAVIHLGGEYDCRLGTLEFHVAVLGFHLLGQWKIADGDLEFQGELRQMMREIEAECGEILGKEHAP